MSSLTIAIRDYNLARLETGSHDLRFSLCTISKAQSQLTDRTALDARVRGQQKFQLSGDFEVRSPTRQACMLKSEDTTATQRSLADERNVRLGWVSPYKYCIKPSILGAR